MEREVRYCTTEDGVRIAYCVEGEGPPLVVVPTFIGSTFHSHLVPEVAEFTRQAGQGCQIIKYDMRGTGLSQRDIADISYPATVRDLEAVVGTLGLKRFSLFSGNLGGPRAILYAAIHPRKVEKMILVATFARLLDVFSEQMLAGFAQLCRANWELAARTFADVGVLRRQSEDFGLRMANWYRASITGETMARYIEDAHHLDVTSSLHRVRCQTLIIHRIGDTIYPFEQAQRLAAAIPGSRFVPLEGDISSALVEDVPLINTFLTGAGTRIAPRTTAAFRTVLFTDIVGHTEMMQRLGDERGREVLREHERITREVLKAHDGTEIKTMGDGFMASFGSVTRAVECAVALQRTFDERNAALSAHPEQAALSQARGGRVEGPRPHGEPLHVRVGLNAGEPIEEEGDLFGASVILAARIAARAGPGEILIPEPVRHLLAGKGFLFADRGEFVAKGFEDPVRLYEVRWRD